MVCPELCLPGYPAEDLYLKRHFLAANAGPSSARRGDRRGDRAGRLCRAAGSTHASRRDAPGPRPAHNAVAVLRDGEVDAIYRKNRLPNYGVFDEVRYFEPGSGPLVIDVDGVGVGITICEDVWEPGPPASDEAEAGAQLIVNPSGSPYLRAKGGDRVDDARRARPRLRRARSRSATSSAARTSWSSTARASSSTRAANWSRALASSRPTCSCGSWVDRPARVEEPLDDLEEVYGALVLGVRDYVRKNGFERALVGVSGGIDSALVALIAADALGADRLTCVVMPSPHSSDATQADARAIAANLGAELIELPIGPAMDAYAATLGEHWSGAGLAAENVQARIRGNLLMALSNDRGGLVLTTGNKSEMSVGYATLYGDMAGGLAVIKDVPKQLVYELVRHRNARAGDELVPASVVDRAPSAELRADQLDEDSLPPYEVLDRVLEGYVERDESATELAGDGASPSSSMRSSVWWTAPSTSAARRPRGSGSRARAFGRDRRLPITNRFGG